MLSPPRRAVRNVAPGVFSRDETAMKNRGGDVELEASEVHLDKLADDEIVGAKESSPLVSSSSPLSLPSAPLSSSASALPLSSAPSSAAVAPAR
jgi:hypothetical protein